MSTINDIIWFFPLFGGIITIFSLLTPAAVPAEKSGKLIWMWGLIMNSSISFLENIVALIVSISCSLLILIVAVMLIFTAIKFNKGLNQNLEHEKIWLPMGILIAVLAIIWMISMNLLFSKTIATISMNESELEISAKTYRFWDYYFPGFGIIGIFIGATLPIIGSFLKMNFRREMVKIIKK